jgi:AAA family ATP:ADP antiporter
MLEPMPATAIDRLSDWLGLHRGERRDAFFGFATLLVIIAGHTMLETARDTLFLSDLPAERLPWAYLAIAALAMVMGGALGRVTRSLPRRHTLTATLLVAAAVSVVFWRFAADPRPATLFAFYVWTGLAASLVTVQLWLRAASTFDVDRAKRVFTLIGAGGLAGATIGAALASVVVHFARPHVLILGGALLFAGAAVVNALWANTQRTAASLPAGDESPTLALLRRDPYLWRLLALTIVATVVVTGLDYLFKAVVADSVPRPRLGHFIARYNTAVNASALVFQLFLAPRVIRGAGVIGALLVLPAILAIATGATAAFGGLAWILVGKAADGTMRHSLDRAGNEILHLPLTETVREHWKAVTTGLGQRGGQAFASLALLAAVSLGASQHAIAGGLAVLAVGWVACVLALRPLYVGRFREQLRTFRVGSQGTLPPLDLEALEILVTALGSADNAEVIAALDVLEAYEKQHLVSPVLVRHPSREVALRAVRLLAASPRADVPRLVADAGSHADGEVRAAALRLQSAHAPDEAALRRALRDESPAVRCAALVGLVAAGFLEGHAAEDALHEVLSQVTPEVASTLAGALVDLPAPLAHPLARELSANPDPAVGVAVARALAAEPNPVFLETLLALLVDRDARPDARMALVALGDAALVRLERALEETTTPRALRLHVPRTSSRFASAQAAGILVRRLPREDDQRVRYKILRGLGRLRTDDPALPVDAEALRAAAERFLGRAATLLAYRVAWETLAAAGAVPADRDLLPDLLEDKERRALESVFRVLHILEPNAEYALVSRGLAASDPQARAGGREILENVLRGSLRPALLAMTDTQAPAARLARLLEGYEHPDAQALLAADDGRRLDLAHTLLGRLAEDPNDVLREIAQHELAAVHGTNAQWEEADAG